MGICCTASARALVRDHARDAVSRAIRSGIKPLKQRARLAYDRPINDPHEADVLHQITTKSARPWIDESENAQADRGLHGPGNALEPETHSPACGGQDGACWRRRQV
jgi:hypothetical protein